MRSTSVLKKSCDSNKKDTIIGNDCSTSSVSIRSGDSGKMAQKEKPSESVPFESINDRARKAKMSMAAESFPPGDNEVLQHPPLDNQRSYRDETHKDIAPVRTRNPKSRLELEKQRLKSTLNESILPGTTRKRRSSSLKEYVYLESKRYKRYQSSDSSIPPGSSFAVHEEAPRNEGNQTMTPRSSRMTRQSTSKQTKGGVSLKPTNCTNAS